MIGKAQLRWPAAVLLPLLLTGCAGLYFREVKTPPQPLPRYTLDTWPSREYWTGIIFNGEKIGLTHLALLPPAAPGGPYELRSEALLAFHFLGLSKKVTLKARDWVTGDLRLERFVHEYDLDGRTLTLSGTVEGGGLHVQREAGGKTTTDTIPLEEPVYPSSAIALYPTLQGLEVGRRLTYQVYDGQLQAVARVTQTIKAYQESDLYEGRAFQVATSMEHQKSTLWLNERGEPVLEMAMNGILISTLESEKRAKTYLARASLNKREVLLDYSRVRTNRVLRNPREVTMLQVAVSGTPATFVLPSDRFQQCGPRAGQSDGANSGRVECLIRAADLSPPSEATPAPAFDPTPDLGATPAIQSDDPQIRQTARDIVGDRADPRARIKRLVEWLRTEVTQEPVDVFSSREVLNGRKAECQGLTLLYTAFARSLGIPTRVTNGLVYSGEFDGFLYHTWAESFVGGRWLPVDPTFGQVVVDATHIKLLDGERPADLMPLVDLVGKIRVEILAAQPL